MKGCDTRDTGGKHSVVLSSRVEEKEEKKEKRDNFKRVASPNQETSCYYLVKRRAVRLNGRCGCTS